MTDTKTKLQELKERAANPDLSLSEIAKLSEELQVIFAPLLEDKNKKEERLLTNEVRETINTAICSSIDKWEKGKIEPEKEEVKFLYGYWEIYKYIEANWAALEKSINENKKVDADEKQKNIRMIKKNMEELKKRESALEKLFQKYMRENFSQSEEEDSDSSNSPEENTKKIKLLEQKIIEFEEAIEMLKKKQTDSTDESVNQQIQQYTNDLQEQKKNIQTQLDQLKNNASSSLSSSTTSASTDQRNKKEKKFPIWGIILIILVILVIAGIVGYLILEKKERPNPKKSKNK